MQLLDSVNQSSIILISTLYIIGVFLKNTMLIKDKYIPIALIAIGIFSSIGLSGLNVNSALQGILVTGVAVLGNPAIKQLKKDE
ncbi:hypothetical protein Curi_c21980 [Gottschalkia acidurici 9a]|uniref:Holin n=1 Tax=Gottschalkia acidurici (strain ATCC 7906 / DSM 604 / BCRC 14475 / CIP 104303 / KCTC 5404 / NCIMB 10678 / 9a) TaxID=1128398 RepID=K0B3L1_GOTA9|nr:phage holin family protein [Gottschalkia acidurici]AFS79201.1 hypothetical protein Curi_c21980 [Gottschalkia acidurici 9a]